MSADALVLEIYRATQAFPAEERFGLQGQLRRAAVSVCANLVEGASRRSEREYLRYVEIALGSASETRYLAGVATRLGLISAERGSALGEAYSGVIKALQALATVLEQARRATGSSES